MVPLPSASIRAVTTSLIALIAMPTAACSMAGSQRPSMVQDSAGYRDEATESISSNTMRRDAPAREAPVNQLLRLAEGDDDVPEGAGTGGALGGIPAGGPPAGPGPQGQPPVTTPAPIVDTRTDKRKHKQALVVEGWVSLRVDEVPEVAAAIRTQVEALGGRLTNEQLSGGERSWSGRVQIKLPPDRVDEFLAWLAERGDIENKRIQGTDVSRTLFDQQIALDNMQLTLDRMRKLLDKEGMEMKDILAIEKEMTRLRGEIERIKGAKRFLEYRVSMATLDINLRRRDGVILGRAEAKFYPGARLSTLWLLDPDGREATRFGGGAVVHVIPRLTFELDVFKSTETESTAVIATFGGALYSDFLGRGKRRFLNPYLGVRLGYGNLDGSAFVFAGGGGVELFKHEYFLLDAGVNFVGFVRKQFDATVSGSLSAVVAF